MIHLGFSFPLTALHGNSCMFDQFNLMYSEQMYYMIMIVVFLHLSFYRIMCFKNSCIQNSKGGMLYRHRVLLFTGCIFSPHHLFHF